MVATVVLGLGTALFANAQDSDEPNPSEALAEARGTAAQLMASVDSVRTQFQKAQKEGDPIKAVCLDDKLTQLEDASVAVSSRLESIEEAVKSGNQASLAQNVSVMKALGQSASSLSASAKQCIGDEKAEVGVSDSLNIVIDPNIVQSNVIQGTSLNSAAVAASVQAETPATPTDDMMRGPIEVSPTN
jgi:hypothetical protein